MAASTPAPRTFSTSAARNSSFGNYPSHTACALVKIKLVHKFIKDKHSMHGRVAQNPFLHHAIRVRAQITASYIHVVHQKTASTLAPRGARMPRTSVRPGVVEHSSARRTPHAACVMSRNSRTGYLYGLSNQARLSCLRWFFCSSRATTK
jgi:hypothetical protein